MDLIVWAVLAIALAWAAEWLLNRFTGPDRSYSRWSWQRVALRIGSLILAGGITWRLLDIGGQLMFNAALQTGDEASIAAAQPHPLIQPNGTWFVVLLVLGCLALALDMIVRPQRHAPHFASGVNVNHSTLRKVRVYGWIVGGLGVLMAMAFGAALFASP